MFFTKPLITKKITSFLVFIALYLITISAFSQDHLNPINPKDYSKWERLGIYSFSKDAQWVLYSVSNNAGDKNINLFHTGNKSEIAIKNASQAKISTNSKWLGYYKALPGKEAKALAKKRKKAKDRDKYREPDDVVIRNLKTGDTLLFKDVRSFKFSNKGDFIALKKGEKNVGTLIIYNLDNGTQVSLGNISQYTFKDQSDLLALITETKDSTANSVRLFDPLTGRIEVLQHEKAKYGSLRWKKDGDDLLAIKTVKDNTYKDDTYGIIIWKGLTGKKPSTHVFDQTKFSNFPENTRVINSRMQLSDNWDAVYFNTFKRKRTKSSEEEKTENKKEEEDEDSFDDEAPEVEIWNSSDVVIIPAQKKSRMQDLETPKLAVWNVNENTFVQLENELTEKINLQYNNRIMLATDRTPYDQEAMFGRPNYDVYRVDKLTGARKKILSKAVDVWEVGPANRYFAYQKGNEIFLFDMQTGQSTNLTSRIDDSLLHTENDHPTPHKPAFGVSGWSKDGKSFFLKSEYDMWQVFPKTGKIRRLTHGKKDAVVYRLMKFDRDEEFYDTSKALFYSLDGKWSKKTGIAKGKAGKTPAILLFEDAQIGRFVKAKKNEKLLFKKQSYQQSPNIYLTGTGFKTVKKVSNTNAFQKNYVWGKAELINYTNMRGNRAQGILYYPANYQKGKKYPMITYIYERLSNRLHSYIAPSRTNYYNTTVWVQNGYFVFNPDIEFTEGDPGISSARNLELAVAKVVGKGDVDPKKVGLIGHSWGGYQAGYVPTQTNIFAASVAGAGLTDLISMYLAVTPAFGGRPENDHFEVGQERMGAAPWKIPENYIRNSSVMQIEKLQTPILFEVGDNDTNVNWAQGIEYYNAARRAGKPFVLLVYAKEGHGLRNDKNKIDYQQRILKWFGHYLKGEPAEDWIIKGVPYGKQREMLENWNKNK